MRHVNKHQIDKEKRKPKPPPKPVEKVKSSREKVRGGREGSWRVVLYIDMHR